MILFSDILGDDEAEFFSDAYKVIHDENKEIVRVRCKMERESSGVTCDTGANPSQEEQEEEQAEDGEVQNIAIVLACGLMEVTTLYPSKKDFLTYFKGYLKKLQCKLEENGCSCDEIGCFKTAAQNLAKEVVGKYGDVQLFVNKKDDEYDPQCYMCPIVKLPEADEFGNEYEALFLRRALKEVKY